MGLAPLTDTKTAASSNTNTPSTAAQAAASADPVVRAMGQAATRIQSQLDTTSTQLSSFGASSNHRFPRHNWQPRPWADSPPVAAVPMSERH